MLNQLILTELVWLAIVGVGFPIYAVSKSGDIKELRGLNLPRGSIRAILALAITGAFVIFLVFVPFLKPPDPELVDKVLVAFGTLSGSVTGFYFGGRSATPKPE